MESTISISLRLRPLLFLKLVLLLAPKDNL